MIIIALKKSHGHSGLLAMSLRIVLKISIYENGFSLLTTDEYSVGDWKGHQPSMESSHCKAISWKREKTEKYKICEKRPFEILCPEEIKNLLQFHRRGKQYKKREYQNWLIPIISFL